jgi:hypothetical protein
MRLINVETRQLVNFFQGNVPAYASMVPPIYFLPYFHLFWGYS